MSSASGARRRPYTTKDSSDDNRSTRSNSTPDQPEDQTSRIISPLDLLRVVITLIGVSCALSYYLTSGASLYWNYDPWFTQPAKIANWWQGPLHLTPEQLSVFDGSDPNKPIYLAINGKIFDVSAGRHTYGPGGSYEVFAGRDATRAFVTGCFLEDRTGDMRGPRRSTFPSMTRARTFQVHRGKSEPSEIAGRPRTRCNKRSRTGRVSTAPVRSTFKLGS